MLEINGLWLLLFGFEIIQERLVLCENVPEPVGLFPLNSLHTTKDISNSYLTAGTAVGVSLAPGPDGKPGGSYNFPGSASSYIEIPQQAQLDTRFSFSFLVWIYNQGSLGPVFHYDIQSGSYAIHFYITGSPSMLFVRMVKRGSLAFVNALTHEMGTINNWRYVGYTYDYSTGKQQLFVDGMKVNEGNVGSIQLSTNYKIKIGGAKYGDKRLFKGRVSCLQIFNKALTQAQVLAARTRCVEKNDYTSCFQCVFLDDPTRALKSNVSGQPADRQALVRRRWYRLKSEAGTRIVTSCPAPGSCGAQSPGWLNGQYPSLETGIKKMEICYRSGSNCCANKATVYVRQCYGYPVFMLDDVPDISLGNRVCTGTDQESIFPNAMFQSTNEKCLSGHVIYAEINVVEASVCIGYCLSAGKKCESVNFIQLDNGTCQLNNATAIEFPQHVNANSSCTYYQSNTALMSYVMP
ncbi:uncharacterized protein LOC116301965 isoform X2 [Actinia tenebrosa]|uniref:Uncharacterized protein LOC116301965 isoform X2 n=1 Tax=Actinia tenebrosa TaxID=6105 RepID=A0A6P8IJS1_ACTTE|nr:uncharacterized protein LOC116301965 isoform X2 [Actinia tenebrosa]